MNESLEFLVKKNMMMKMLIVQKMSANNLSRLLYIKKVLWLSLEGKRTFIVSFKSLGGAWKKGDIIFSGTKRYV